MLFIADLSDCPPNSVRRKTKLTDETGRQCKAGHPGPGIGSIWFIGWLFTIGYVQLTFWKAVLALIIWPYYLGVSLR
jgi:hypothetical protein